MTAPLVNLICRRQHDYPTHTQMEQRQRKTRIHTSNRSEALTKANALNSKLPTPQQRGMEQASEKGASSWLNTTPLSKYGFNHQLLTEVYPNVGVEPALQPLSGERFHQRSTNTEDGARLDIRAPDFWDKSKRSTFFDVRVFNSHAPSNCMPSTEACYRRHEQEKRRTYEKRVIEDEKGTFTPSVLSSSGGCATVALKRLAGLVSEKHGQPYSSALAFIRCRLAFSLINSTVACLRAPRSTYHAAAMEISLSDNPLDSFVLRPSCPTN